MKIYKLISKDIRNIGSQMGYEETKINWVKYFTKIEYAKTFAEKDYGEKITWSFDNSSCDLNHVIYYIKQVKIEK